MNTGKTLFAQLMGFLPWSTFDRIVARYNGNRAVRTLPCAAQYQVMAFAQITYRESLPATIWTWICPAPSTRSTRRPSIYVCRCFHGRIFVRPRRQ